MRRSLLLLCSFLLALTAYPHQAAHADRADQHGFKALVFTKTAGFRHQSISAGIRAIQGLSVEHEFDADFTEDAALFTDANLATYDVVIFLNTTGDVLNEEQQQAFERFIQAGNGFVGVHSASDTEYDWPFYGGMIGAYFESHPSIQAATVNVVDREHPSTRTLP
ncbi:MAG: ThuA domain-containing protein, partial [Bacteroidota bacterium]